MLRLDEISESDSGTGETDGSATTSRLRCDVLFAASREPVLIVEADSGLIMDANPSAARLLQICPAELIGAALKTALDQRSLGIVNAGFALAQISGGTHMLNICGSRGGEALCVRISVFWTRDKLYFLMRLGSSDADAFLMEPLRSDSTMFQLIDEAPVGFLMTDANLQIDYANRAFISMIGPASRANLRGTPLARWLNFTAAELAALQKQLCQRQAVTRLKSSLRCARRDARQVEVHAIAVPDDQAPCWGFSVALLRLLN
jgi:nitrogen-specific signal transduction histidine kinase